MLAHMEKPELLFICTCDVLMIISGFAGFISNDPRAVWPLFAFSEWWPWLVVRVGTRAWMQPHAQAHAAEQVSC